MNRLFRVVMVLGGVLGQAWGHFGARLSRLLDICAMFYRLLLGGFIGPPCIGLFFRELSRRINSDTVKVSKVRVSETPGAGADYWEE